MANVALSFHGAPDAHGLEVRHFDVAEALSTPFEAAVVVVSRDHDLDFEKLLGKGATFKLDRGPLGARAWTGIVASIESLEGTPGAEGLATYQLRIVPALWLSRQSCSHRLFQHQTTPAIVATVLHRYGIEATFRLTGAPPAVHELRVQHGETDFAFVSRLLEEAGESYAFEDTAKGSALVITDEPGRAEARAHAIPVLAHPSPSSASVYLTDVSVAAETRPGSVSIGDYDFRRPRYGASYLATSGNAGERKLEHDVYAPGGATIDAKKVAGETSDTPAADLVSRSRIDDQEGHAMARRTLDAMRFEDRCATFTTNAIDLAPGVVFLADGNATLGAKAKLAVTRMSYEGKDQGAWRINGAAAFAMDAIRPPLKQARPQVVGLQSAIVTGPAGQEIHTDEFGRVRVRFPWDREGQSEETRSCWVRVDESSAGVGFGTIAIPRVGEEVLIAYYDGDPNQPIVVGRAFDAANPPPYALPAAKAKSVWRSRSTPGGSGYNEVSFDDRKGHELLFLRAERDFERIVKRAEVEETGRDRSVSIGRNRAETIALEDTSHAGELHSIGMGKGGAGDSDTEDMSLAALPTKREIIADRIMLTTGGATIMLDGPDIVVSADKSITLKAGGTVSIQGEPYVHLNPPLVTKGGHIETAAGPDHIVWFQLFAEGEPLAGARVHVTHEDGSHVGSHVTDGAGMVRVPVDKPGVHSVTLGTPRKEKLPASGGAEAPAASSPPAPAAPAPAAKPSAPKAPSAPSTIDVGKTPSQPTAKAKPTQHDVPVEIEILDPKPNTTWEIDPGHIPTPAPSMPHIPLKARVLVQGAEVSIGTVRWEMYLSGQYRVRSVGGGSYVEQPFKFPAGHVWTKPSEDTKFELAPASLCGGLLEVRAVFEGAGDLAGITARKSVTGCKVLGKNPTPEDIGALVLDLGGDLAWAFLRIFAWESTYRQFATNSSGGNTPGQPLYGPPSGVGIVQRDAEYPEWHFPKNRLTEANNLFPRIFYDWKKNVEEGISSFRSDYMNRATYELNALRREYPHLPAYPEALVLRSAIRHYNGGNEYSSNGTHYIVSPSDTNNPGYVKDVLYNPLVDAKKFPIPAAAEASVWP